MPKGTKTIKVGDRKQQKAWLKKSNSSEYLIEQVSTNKTILIVCEGQSEEFYFRSFPIYSSTVKIENTKGESKLTLVERTKAYIKRTGTKYDHVWCVFDMDVNKGEKEFADFDNAIIKAVALKYHVAYSNDAFELWFYLHFEYTDQQNLRGFYYEELGKKWGINYEKDGKKRVFCNNLYNLLLADNASQTKAIASAKKLHENQQNLNYHLQNPVTTVYKLVELLNENLRK
jgi:RloB-like protein